MDGFPLADLPAVRLRAERLMPGLPIRQYAFLFAPGADEAVAAAVVERITGARELVFWDAEHPTWSDPGAYIFLIRHPGGFLAQRANNGWSSDWVSISEAEAVRYLTLCIPFHGERYEEDCILYEPIDPGDVAEPYNPSRRIDWSKRSPFRLYLTERLRGSQPE